MNVEHDYGSNRCGDNLKRCRRCGAPRGAESPCGSDPLGELKIDPVALGRWAANAFVIGMVLLLAWAAGSTSLKFEPKDPAPITLPVDQPMICETHYRQGLGYDIINGRRWPHFDTYIACRSRSAGEDR